MLGQFADRAPVLPAAANARKAFVVTVQAADTGKPLAGVVVYGFTDRATLTGVQDVTGAEGTVRLLLPASVTEFDVIEMDAPFGYWARPMAGRYRSPLANCCCAARPST